jgi:ABC-2 type transport system permease protein
LSSPRQHAASWCRVAELLVSWRLYRLLIGARIRSHMQYKVSFALNSIANAMFTVTEFLAVGIAVRHVPALAGWSLAQVSLLFGLSYLSFAAAEAIAAGFDGFHRHVLEGTFDRILVRPLGTFFQIFSSDLAIRRIGRALSGILAIAIALPSIEVDWTPDRVAVLALGSLSGVAIYFAIFVVGAASAFWTTQSNEAINVFTNGGNMITSYPLDIFDGWLRRLITFVVPLAFINYYPALYVFDRPDPLGLPDWSRLASPLAALAAGLIAFWIWTAGVRRYQSTGS